MVEAVLGFKLRIGADTAKLANMIIAGFEIWSEK